MFLRIPLRPIIMSGVKRDSAMANLSWPSSNNRASPPSTSEADTHMEPTTGTSSATSTATPPQGQKLSLRRIWLEVHQHYPFRFTSTISDHITLSKQSIRLPSRSTLAMEIAATFWINEVNNNGFSRLREPEDFFFRLTGNKTMAPRLSDLVYRFDMEAPLWLISLRINVRLLLPHPHRWFPNWHPS